MFGSWNRLFLTMQSNPPPPDACNNNFKGKVGQSYVWTLRAEGQAVLNGIICLLPPPVIARFQHLAVLAIWVFVVALIFNKWNKITTDPDILVSGESGCGSQAIYNVFCEIMARVGGFVIVLAFGSVTFQNQCFFFSFSRAIFSFADNFVRLAGKFFLTFLTPSKRQLFMKLYSWQFVFLLKPKY